MQTAGTHSAQPNHDHYDSRYLLAHQQHGFRSRWSYESQLLITVESLAKALDYGEQVDVILLDFFKAFEKVPHQDSSINSTSMASEGTRGNG